MYSNCKKCLLVFACCLSTTVVNSTTIFTPTVSNINFSVTTGQLDNFGFTRAFFNDTSLSGGGIAPNVDHLTTTISELIYWDFTQTLSNSNPASSILDIGTDVLFILAVSPAGDDWMDGDPDCESVKTSSETNQYVIVLNSVGDLDAIAEIAPVYVPPAAWLFSSGLLGLVGVARRKKA